MGEERGSDFCLSCQVLKAGFHTHKNKFAKIGGSSFALVVCATTKEYRYQVQAHVSSNDVVLEIGSSHGKTTDMISKRTNKVVGVDFINSLVLESKKKIPTQSRFFSTMLVKLKVGGSQLFR